LSQTRNPASHVRVILLVQLNPPGLREGLGIGLALVKRIMELHGGSVEAISDGEGKGSTFRFLKPVDPDAINRLIEQAKLP
jgi:signal transduction histidine kinase